MTDITMNKRQKKGISTVLTTLIIVVASVVLGTAVTLFGTSLFQTGAQQQSMAVSNTHLWFNTASATPQVEGAVVVRNTGDKLIAVDNIKVRNAIVSFSNWAASATTITPSEAAAQFEYLSSATTPAYPPATFATYDLDGTAGAVANAVVMTTQAGPVSLDPGKSVIIYFQLPAGQTILSAADIGASASVTVAAGQINTVQSVSVASVNV